MAMTGQYCGAASIAGQSKYGLTMLGSQLVYERDLFSMG